MEDIALDRLKRPRTARKWLYLSISGLLVGAAAIGLLVAHRGHSNPDSLPKTIITQIQGFTPYYFTKNTPPDGLHLKAGSTAYSNGVLIFSLTDSKGQTVTLSEQILPAEFSNSKLQGDESLNTASGPATLSSLIGGRTTGSLVTKDKTFILLNTADPVELNTIKDILRAMTPVK